MIYFVLFVELMSTFLLLSTIPRTLFIVVGIIVIIFIFVELLELVEDHRAEGKRVKHVREVVVRETVVDREIQKRNETILLETVLSVGIIETQGAAQEEEEISQVTQFDERGS
jgi:ABC-type Na+ efflux pump permease subunit